MSGIESFMLLMYFIDCIDNWPIKTMCRPTLNPDHLCLLILFVLQICTIMSCHVMSYYALVIEISFAVNCFSIVSLYGRFCEQIRSLMTRVITPLDSAILASNNKANAVVGRTSRVT